MVGRWRSVVVPLLLSFGFGAVSRGALVAAQPGAEAAGGEKDEAASYQLAAAETLEGGALCTISPSTHLSVRVAVVR